MFFKGVARIAAIVVVLLAIAAVGLYSYIVSGGLIARQRPPAVEKSVTRWMLDVSVPDSAKTMKNPLTIDSGSVDAFAGQELYKQKCEICHGYDGSGKTEAGGGEYPQPLNLRGPEVSHATDGELFYFIRNGIRNTAMPGWPMPDQDTWRLVLYIRNLPNVASLSARDPRTAASPGSASYVGSAACKSCHSSIYERWSKTRMANVVRDPKEHPDAIIPDLSKPDPLLTFTKEDIAFVYGSKWKQRYFKKIGDDYFPLPAQWDVTHKFGAPTTLSLGPTGGLRIIQRTTCTGPPGPLAMAATRSTTTFRPSRSRNGMWAAKNAMGRAASMSSSPKSVERL